MIKDKIIFSVLASLGLVEGEKNDANIQKAAQKALNDDKFELQTYKGVALRSILGTLNKKDIAKYLKPQNTSLENSFFELSDKAEDTSKQLEVLKNALKSTKDDDETLLWILERFATTLAVSEKHNTVSLFDFVKLTSAFAYCFQESDKVRMVSANISGIQSYLYEIVSKNAAKLLKGRSFYLQLLGDSILNEFLEKFKVKSYNVIYASGGGFYVLVPDYPEIDKIFDSVTAEISKKIFAVHKTNLFVETAMSKPFDGCEKLQETWDDLFKDLKKRRNNRLSWNEALRKNFFGFVEDGGDVERDPITNEEMTSKDETDERFGVKMLKITAEQIDLGTALRNANYWYSTSKNKKEPTIIDPLENYHYFDDKKLNFDSPFLIKTFNHFDNETTTLLYGGNEYPVFNEADKEYIDKENEKTKKEADKKGVKVKSGDLYRVNGIKPFDALAQGESLDRLAILRMDVDGLGSVFSNGFGNLTKYSTVSRTLDLFFKGYLNTLWKNYDNTTQIIYSGGDDLFVVGKWNDVFAFARDIHKAFKEWSCGVLTLSGGIVLLPAKFPVMQGAKMAERAEKAAKKHECNGQKKNAICFLDVPLNWDEELLVVRDLFDKIKVFIEEGKLNQSFIRKIDAHALMAKNENSHQWRWIMAYDLSRYSKNNKVKPEVKTFLEEIASNTFLNYSNSQKLNSKFSYLQLLHVATRWVELELRTNKNSTNGTKETLATAQ